MTVLERKYADFPGLNLTNAVLTGLAKHETPYDHPGTLEPELSPSLEAQLVNLADEIAYTSSDCDDAVRAGIFGLDMLRTIPLWCEAETYADPELPEESFVHRSSSGMFALLIADAVRTTDANVRAQHIATPEAVALCPRALAGFSVRMREELNSMRKFLMQYMYAAPVVKEKSTEGTRIMEKVFTYLMERRDAPLPAEFLDRFADEPREIVVADFIAGMTDSFVERYAAELC